MDCLGAAVAGSTARNQLLCAAPARVVVAREAKRVNKHAVARDAEELFIHRLLLETRHVHVRFSSNRSERNIPLVEGERGMITYRVRHTWLIGYSGDRFDVAIALLVRRRVADVVMH
jgi:hypothetical protein